MFSLTEDQIAFIENDIRVRGITSSDLRIDLLDHICCLVENESDGTENFELVYERILLLFGAKGLREIQDETNRLLTFKHYYIMNATMKISGYVSSIMILLGAILKINHLFPANILIVSGVFFFTVLFLPLMFILKYKSEEESNRSILLSIIGGIASIIISIGVLFKIMHWPGSLSLTLTGAVLLVLGYLPVYFISIYKKTTNKINATSTAIILIAFVGLFLSANKNDMGKNYADSLLQMNENTNQMLSFVEVQNKINYKKIDERKAIDSMAIRKIKLLRAETDELDTYIQNLKTHLIACAENISEATAMNVKLEDLHDPGEYQIPTSLLLMPSNSDSPYTAVKLKNKIEKFKQTISNRITSDVNLTDLNTDSTREDESWELMNFRNIPLAFVIHRLTQIELAVKTTESILLNQLQ